VIADATSWTASEHKATFHLAITVKAGVLPASTLVNAGFGAVLPDRAAVEAAAAALSPGDLSTILGLLAACDPVLTATNCHGGLNCAGSNLGSAPSCTTCKQMGGKSWTDTMGGCSNC